VTCYQAAFMKHKNSCCVQRCFPSTALTGNLLRVDGPTRDRAATDIPGRTGDGQWQ